MTQNNQSNIGSSETTRESPFYSFDFTNYIEYHRPDQKCQEDISITISFLEWFIGFTEGDGCFEHRLEEKRPRLSFNIVQKDACLLYKLKKGLGFGSVYHFTRVIDDKVEAYSRFSVGDKRGIQRLQSIFNGNLVLPKKRAQFNDWVNFKEKIQHPTFSLSHRYVLPTLETAWISGFIEAEGCFYVESKDSETGFKVKKQKLTLTQSDTHGESAILEHISILFEDTGKLYLAREGASPEKPNAYRIEIRTKKRHKIVVEYLQRFCLKGKKRISFFRWWRIYLMRLNELHLLQANQKKLKRLCQSVNKDL